MKKWLVLLVSFMVLLGNAQGVLAYEYIPYIGEGVIRSSPVSVRLEKGADEVQSIAEAEKISAFCKVKPGSEFEESVRVSLVLAVYDGNCLTGFEVSGAAEFTSAKDGAKDLFAEIDVSGKKANAVKVYLWDSIENARPLLNMGEYGSRKSGIEGVIIGGERVDLDTSSKTGSVEVNAGFVKWPDVIVLANNITSDVRVELRGTFPLSKPAHTMTQANAEVDGTSETAVAVVKVGDEEYTISVTQAVPQITDVRFREYKANMASVEPTYYTDSQLMIQYDIQNPIWTDELPGPHIEVADKAADGSVDNVTKYSEGVKNLENYCAAYSDRLQSGNTKMFYIDIAPELVGAQYFTPPYSADANNDTVEDCYTFTIDRSARIYVQHTSMKLGNGWTRMAKRFNSESGKYCTYYEFRVYGNGSSLWYSTGNRVFYKDFIVEPGSTCTISLPSDSIVPRIFVKYMDTDFVTNVSYTENGEEKMTDVTEVIRPLYADENAETDRYKIYNPNGTSTKVIQNGGNLISCTSTFLDEGETKRSQFGLVAVPDELVGGMALITPFLMTDVSRVEFDLKASARVYMLTSCSAKLMEELGEEWRTTNFRHNDSSLNEANIAVAYKNGDNTFSDKITNRSSFVRDFIVPQGETEHVTLDLPASYMNGQKAVFVIQPLSE